MNRIRRAAERGFADHGWLKSHHTFSFADYRDPEHVRFRSLRVMNEDWVAPSQGFGNHPHADMEIVTYVLSGQLEHRDSMGNGEILRPGEFQRMSAGDGITHSEFNPSSSEPVHLYQIWLFPSKKGLKPSYEQKPFSQDDRRNQWQLVASPAGQCGSLRIHQDANILLADLSPGNSLEYATTEKRYFWLQVLRGHVLAEDQKLECGDGLAISEEQRLKVSSERGAELMLFDLA
jgi:quercetin 2,3-dioxygenase